MAEVELDNVRENGVKMSVETKQNNLRDYILSWSSQKGKRRFLRNAQNIVKLVRRNSIFACSQMITGKIEQVLVDPESWRDWAHLSEVGVVYVGHHVE